MPDWLKKLTGGNRYRNTVDLPAADIKLLEADFAVLDSRVAGIGERLVRYALDGDDTDVLATLGSVADAADALQIKVCGGYGVQAQKERKQFFAQTKCLDPLLYLRLARIYDAASTTKQRRLRLTGLGGGLEWLEVFLMEALQVAQNMYPLRNEVTPAFGVETIEAMMQAAGQNPDALVRGAFFTSDAHYHWNMDHMFLLLNGFAESIARYPATVLEALADKDVDLRVHALNLLGKCPEILPVFRESIVEMAVSSSKKVRKATENLLPQLGEQAVTLIEAKLAGGNNDERQEAARLLWKIRGESSRDLLAQRVEAETSKKNSRAIAEMLAVSASISEADATGANFDLPPVAEVASFAPLSDAVRTLLEQCAEEHHRRALAHHERYKAQYQGKAQLTAPSRLAGEKIERIFKLLQSLEVGNYNDGEIINRGYEGTTIYRKLIEHPEFQLIHVVRLSILLGLISKDRTQYTMPFWGLQYITSYRRFHKLDFGLRELAAAMRAVGLDDSLIAKCVLQRYRWDTGPGLPFRQEAHWGYFAERLDVLAGVFGIGPALIEAPRYSWESYRENAFHIFAEFPSIPPQFLPVMWEIALGPAKGERALAQKCLARVPDKNTRIAAALQSGQQDARAVAAEWLGRLGDPGAVPALLAALKKERQEVAKGAMMTALEKLGASLDEFVDAKQLQDEASKGLAKGIPAGLAWFPFASLPSLRWSATGKQVAPEIVRWFIVQAFRLKTAEPGPLLRIYGSLFHADDRAALGKFIVEAWIAQDTVPKYSQAEAAQMAEVQAKQSYAAHVRFRQMYPKIYPNATPDVSEEDYYRGALAALLRETMGTATDSKGILAVAAACATGEIAPQVNAYIKQWYGYRASQCRSLIQMISWIDDARAIQMLLSIGNRFRTKSIQDEANERVKAVAERKGWTLDELADRTIPTAGFDDEGVLELDYGTRKFTARLGEEFGIALANPAGKEIASLPDPNQSDDEAMAKEAKKLLSNARKEVKTTLKLQRDRLYESMCTQRTWRYEDWETYLLRHPLVGRYCEQLVWVAYSGETAIGSFRPLADRTLTDNQDESVVLEAAHTVRLAHDCTLPAGEGARWLAHLADYEVAPLFDQFGKQLYTLSESAREATEIKEFEGYLLEAFKLRGRATKLGYTRGKGEDGGWFMVYRKGFQTLGFDVVIEFSGNSLPEENRTVALQSLYWERADEDGGMGGGEKPTLVEIPSVLLCEAWNDMRVIAAEGSGFDPEWQKKVG